MNIKRRYSKLESVTYEFDLGEVEFALISEYDLDIESATSVHTELIVDDFDRHNVSVPRVVVKVEFSESIGENEDG